MTTLTFDPYQMLSEVVLVGVGGTGSQWARQVCRMVYDLAARQRHVPTITFIDPDRVELSNVGRQLFTAADVGAYKAETLARRFNCSLGLAVRWCNEPFEAKRHAGRFTLLLGAVDNHLARRELAQAVDEYGCIWIDAGNHTESGQVVIGNCGQAEQVLSGVGKSTRCTYLPHAGLIFPALLEPEAAPAAPPAASCAERVAQGFQHLLINDLMAAAAAHYTYKLLYHEPVTTHVTFLDGDSLAMRSQPITADNLRFYLRACQ